MVYWSHSLWPESNGAKPAFISTEAARLSESKVDDVLRKSNALAQLWKQPITGEMLQAEVDRMAQHSKQPERLRELFSSLENDAYLVAEVIARPALVDRLIRSFFSSDKRFKSAGNFDEWWKQSRDSFASKVESARHHYYLPAVVQVQSEVGSWRPMSALPVSTGTVVWTGSEMIIWGGCSTSSSFCGETTGGRYNPLTDTWTPTSTVNAPIERKEHTAVWTGSEMIIWGGCKPGYNNFCNTIGFGSPGAYNPATDTWRVVPDGGIEGRTKHTAIWTGTEMIIWGGIRLDVLNAGGRYNAATNGWVQTSTVNAPTPRENHTARRVNVSAAFFISTEFQEIGYFAYRAHKVAFGDMTSPNVSIGVPRIRLQDFLVDGQFLGRDVRVGIGNWEQQLAANREAYIRAFVNRSAFLSLYPTTLSPTQFVDQLNQNAGTVLTAAERNQLIADLTALSDQSAGRASVLTRIANNSLLRQRETNRAFVLMEYYGYLRRNPDDPQDIDFRGWEFWLSKLNEFDGNFVAAEMVKAFITSGEYRQRFGH